MNVVLHLTFRSPINTATEAYFQDSHQCTKKRKNGCQQLFCYNMINRPTSTCMKTKKLLATIEFCYCVLGCLAFEWKWGWRWTCLHRNLPAFLMLMSLFSCQLVEIDIRKAVRFLSKQGQLSLSFKGQATKHTTVKWSIILNLQTREASKKFLCSGKFQVIFPSLLLSGVGDF